MLLEDKSHAANCRDRLRNEKLTQRLPIRQRRSATGGFHTRVFLSTSETRSAASCYHKAGIGVAFSLQSAHFTVGCIVSIFTPTQQHTGSMLVHSRRLYGLDQNLHLSAELVTTVL